MGELQSVTYHMGIRSDSCRSESRPTRPDSTPDAQAGSRFTYLERMEGWVDLVLVIYWDGLPSCLQVITTW